jgi:Zn-dependent protease with chaperone function
MDFFSRQEDARRHTRRLVVLFVLAVVAVVAAVNVAVVVIFLASEGGELADALLRPRVLAGVSLATLLVIFAGSVYKTSSLRAGGPAVAQLLGGRPIDPNTADAAQRRLLNVVEEMALAAGTPVPTVYLLEDEPGINAFAAGFTSDGAVIGVTRGAIQFLNRDELQGVVGHEFSHILNGDMRLNVRLIGVLHGILVIGLIGYWILRSSGGRSSSSSRKKGGGGIVLFGLALLVIGYVGVFFGKLIKGGLSRQREFLADASAVQFTRNPAGLAGALRKIGGLGAGSRLRNANAEQASHLFFGNGVGEPAFAWLATHPPLAERLRRLDPGFDGTFPRVELPGGAPAEKAVSRRAPAAAVPAAAPAVAPAAAARLTSLAPLAAAALPAAVLSVGAPTRAHLAHAAALLDALPAALREKVHDPGAARAVLCGLLLDADAGVRGSQLEALRASDPQLAAEVEGLQGLAAGCPAESRLALLDLAVPALRRMSAAQWRVFRQLVDRLVEADTRMSVFEFALHHLLVRHVAPAFERVAPPATHYYALNRLAHECSLLLSALAYRGAEPPAAFAAGSAVLPQVDVELLAPEACGLAELGFALATLDTVAAPRKGELLRACAAVIAHDRQVAVEEGELLRAVADALRCPMPPLLAGQAPTAA